ncbi:MAG: prolipoprotein diacylglyceryl transferase [Holosporales bacterium]
MALTYPMIDPVALELGPVVIRWYGLAYVAGILFAWGYCKALIRKYQIAMQAKDFDDFVPWMTLGVVAGGRLGQVLFYDTAYYLANPFEIIAIWHPGMSFHGGILGVVTATVIFCRKRGIPILHMLDLLACAAPIGLFLGRIANFINAELVGRVSDVPWAMVFPGAGPFPRHPSQLYEAVLEGLLLFILTNMAMRRATWRHIPGRVMGLFIAGYGIARIIGEVFREPDHHIGFLMGGTTWGQWLSVPMVILGLYFIFRSHKTDVTR